MFQAYGISKRHTLYSNTSTVHKWKDREKINHANSNERWTWVTVPISYKTNFNTKFLLEIKSDILIEDVIITNITSQCMNQNMTALKREIDNSTLIVGEFNAPLPIINRIIRQRQTRKEKTWITLSINLI